MDGDLNTLLKGLGFNVPEGTQIIVCDVATDLQELAAQVIESTRVGRDSVVLITEKTPQRMHSDFHNSLAILCAETMINPRAMEEILKVEIRKPVIPPIAPFAIKPMTRNTDKSDMWLQKPSFADNHLPKDPGAFKLRMHHFQKSRAVWSNPQLKHQLRRMSTIRQQT